MPRTKKQIDEQDSDNNNDQSEDSQNQLKVNTDNSPKIIPVGKLPDKLKCKKIVLNVSDTQYPIVAEIGQELGWVVQEEQGNGDWDVWWTDRQIEANTLYRMNLHQKINHFPGIYVLARKNLLGLHLMAMQRRFPNDYNFFPQTWMLPMQFHQFRQYYQSVQENKVRTYIVKPQALSQGRGIFLTRNIQDVINGHKYVVQKYLKNPLLLDGLKFDLRIYVLLAGTDPLRLYIYEQGLGRLATRPYQSPTAQNLHENYIHLTNYSLNKTNPEYVYNKSDKQMDTGHKRSLKSVYQRLAKNGIDIEKLKTQIQQSIVKTVISGLPSIRHQYQYCQPEDYQGNMCFHILGFDVMILDDLKPIVIEVNHTPSFQTGTPLDYMIKKNLIKDTLKLMRVSAKQKKALFLKSKELTKRRVQTGKRDILKGQQRKAHLVKFQKVRDEQEKQILFDPQKPSGYKAIFPFKDEKKNEKYLKFYQAAEQVMKQLKDTRKKIISQEKSTTKQPSSSIHTNKNIKSVKNNQATSTKQVTSQKINGRNSSIRIIQSEQKVQSSHVMKKIEQADDNQLKNFNTEVVLQKQEKQSFSPITTKNSFQIRNNKSSTKKQQNSNINEKNIVQSGPSTQTNFNSKYNELMSKFVNSNDLQIETQNIANDQRISLQGQMLFEQRLGSIVMGRKSRNSCQQMVSGKYHTPTNIFFDMKQRISIPKQQIFVPTIKGYKHKVMPSSTKNEISPTIIQKEKSYQNQIIKNSSHNNKNNKQIIGSRQHVGMNFINLSAKPYIVENLFSNNEVEKQQTNKQLKKYGKFVKPKTYNLHQNNFSHQQKDKIVRMGSQGYSIINTKYQTEAIYENKSMTNPYHSNHLNNQHNQNLSNSLVPNQQSYVSRTKVNMNSHQSNKGSSSLLGKPLTGYKNKSNSIIGKINSAHFKDAPLLFKMVQRHKPPGYQ